MPLQDHFHPPLSLRRHWEAFHNAWATSIAYDLNRRLPDGYFAEPNVHFGIEIDVATFEDSETAITLSDGRSEQEWTPPMPVQTVPFSVISDVVEVKVFKTEGGPVLAGAIEMVSPVNKDRAEHREAFVTKCVAYLHQFVGVVIVDVVSSRNANLHAELVQMVQKNFVPDSAAALYASAFRTVEDNGDSRLDIWNEDLSLGQPLPTLPLWLRGSACMAIPLEETYQHTCSELRIPASSQ